jgi:hypothetical protein
MNFDQSEFRHSLIFTVVQMSSLIHEVNTEIDFLNTSTKAYISRSKRMKISALLKLYRVELTDKVKFETEIADAIKKDEQKVFIIKLESGVKAQLEETERQAAAIRRSENLEEPDEPLGSGIAGSIASVAMWSAIAIITLKVLDVVQDSAKQIYLKNQPLY